MTITEDVLRYVSTAEAPVTPDEVAKILNVSPAACRSALFAEYGKPFEKHYLYPDKILCRQVHHIRRNKMPAYAYYMTTPLPDHLSVGRNTDMPTPTRKVKAAPVPPSRPMQKKRIYHRVPSTAQPTVTEFPTETSTHAPTGILAAATALVDAIIEQYIKPLLMQGIAEAIRSATIQVKGSGIPVEAPPFEPAAPPTTEARKRLPRVLILGLLPSQLGQISAEFGHRFDIIGWGNTDHKALKQLAMNSDMVLNHVRHGGHAVEGTLKSVGVTPIRVLGGVSSMREELRKLVAERAEGGSA